MGKQRHRNERRREDARNDDGDAEAGEAWITPGDERADGKGNGSHEHARIESEIAEHGTEIADQADARVHRREDHGERGESEVGRREHGKPENNTGRDTLDRESTSSGACGHLAMLAIIPLNVRGAFGDACAELHALVV